MRSKTVTPTLEIENGRLLCNGVELGTIERDSLFCSPVFPRIICRDVEEFRADVRAKPKWALDAAESCLLNTAPIRLRCMQQLKQNQHEGIRDALREVDSWIAVSDAWRALVGL